MKKVASTSDERKCRCGGSYGHRGRHRKTSNVGAAGVTSRGTPGEQAQGLPRGSDARRWIDGNGVAWRSHLELAENEGRWSIVRVDTTCALGLVERSTLVLADSLRDAAFELAAWSHGLNLPYRDYNCERDETYDPVASWPL